MAPLSQTEERLLELLADRATQGLSAAETEELERLLAAAPGIDPAGFELAAAAIHLTSPWPEEALPQTLEAQLEERAAEFLARSAPVRSEAERFQRKSSSSVQRFGWYAAAACLAAAVAGWWPGRQEIPAPPPPANTAPLDPSPGDGPGEAAPDLAEIATAPDALRLPWTGTEDPAATAAGGEVLWSGELQEGFMRLTGLPANDPTEFQYQLWIFDQTRDERYPVDGGVFDVASTETLVPIDARLEVHQPTLFAVTVEKPGGVVVSSRERIVLVAAVS